jgi:hypothetical protein
LLHHVLLSSRKNAFGGWPTLSLISNNWKIARGGYGV